MNSINLKKFLMGTGGVTPPASILAKLTFTNNTTNDVLDSNSDFKLSDTEARSGISVGQSYATVKKVNIWSDCIEVSLQSFRNYSVYNWNPIEGVSFSSASSLEVIGDYAFSDWTSTNFGTTLNMPVNLKTIGVDAFRNWTSNAYGINLMPATGLTSIGINAFRGWSSAVMGVDLQFPANLTNISSTSFFNWASNIKGVDLTTANSLVTIGNNAFGNWTSAIMSSDLYIPSSVDIIDVGAFGWWSSNPKGVNLYSATSLRKINDNAFSNWNNANSTAPLYIQPSIETIGNDAFTNWGAATSGVNFEDSTGLKSIGDDAFYGWFIAKHYEDIPFQSNLQSIGGSSFSQWFANDHGVDFTNATSLSAIGGYAFSTWTNANMLSNIVIPVSVKTIGEYAFGAWHKMSQSITFSGSGSLQIGPTAFSHWGELGTGITNNLTLRQGTTLSNGSFYAWETMTGRLDLNSDLIIIPDRCFIEWISTTNGGVDLNIPASVTTIEAYAFYHWSSMTKGIIFNGTSLTKISAYAFEGWTNATMTTRLIIPSSVTIIEDRAFWGWGSMQGDLQFNSINPPAFTGVTYQTFAGWTYAFLNYGGIRVHVPVGANLSTWKASLSGHGSFASINGVAWASIP